MSHGGVTFSGGEPALNKDCARELLQRCENNALYAAIETCGECPWTSLEALLPATDLLMMDIKGISPEEHRSLDREYKASTLRPPTNEKLSLFLHGARRQGIEARIRWIQTR